MAKQFTRKQLVGLLGGLALAGIAGCSKEEATNGALPPAAPVPAPKPATSAPAVGGQLGKGVLYIAKGPDPKDNVKRALAGAGGLEKWVKPGSKVVIKPNMAWGASGDSGAVTSPAVVVALIEACKAAGAGSIRVIDHGINPAASVYAASGLKTAIEGAGAECFIDTSGGTERLYTKVALPQGKAMQEDECLTELLEADCFINAPVCKHHNATNVSLALKAMMGANRDRQKWHASQLHQCIADFATGVRAHLVVLDATNVLKDNGPQGPGTVDKANQIIVGADPVAVDAYGATLVGYQPDQVDHIKFAYEFGLGEMSLANIKLNEV